MVSEKWRPVLGFEKQYEVSNLGNVRSLDRHVRSRGGTRKIRGQKLKPNVHNQGYRYVRLSKSRKAYVRLIHRLVVEAFWGAIPKGYEVNHKDGDKTNNHIENLAVVTRSENIRHGVRMGLIPIVGEDNPQSKLTESEVLEIRRLYGTGNYGYKKLAKRFDMYWGTIRDIIKRRIWKHI